MDERLSGRVDESHHRPAVALLVMLWFSDGLVTNQTHVPTDLLGFQYVAPAPGPLVAALAPYLILVFAWPSTLAAPSFPGAGGPVMIVPAHRTRLPAGSSPSPVTARPPGRGGEEGDIMFGRLAVAAIIALALVWPHAASPEVVELNGGDWVQGALKEATPAGVVVEVGGQTVRFATDRVRAIYFVPPSQATPSQPTPAQATPSQPPAAQPQAAQLPPAAPTPPPLSAQPPSSGSSTADALQVVKSLRSALQGGMSFREYQARVNAAATIVDRYLATLPGGPESTSIHDAVRYYSLAESAWNNQGVVSRTAWLRKDDVLSRCSAYLDFVEAMRTKGDAYYAERVRNYVVISDGVIPVLWSCASEKIAEAEAVLADAKK